MRDKGQQTSLRVVPSDWDLVIWEIRTERDSYLGSLNLSMTL